MAPDSNPVEEWTSDEWEAICKSGVYGMTPEAKWPALELWESAVRASERASRVFTSMEVERAAWELRACFGRLDGAETREDWREMARAALAALGEVEGV